MFYPESIVFMAGRFASGQVASMGLVAPGFFTGSGKRLRPGSELYLEIAIEDAGSRRENEATPCPKGDFVSKSAAAAAIKEFMGDDKPYLVTDVTRLEWSYINNLFGLQCLPYEHQPIEVSDILLAAGIDPRLDRHSLALRFNISIDGFRRHHPLDDARLLSSLYYAVKESMKSKELAARTRQDDGKGVYPGLHGRW